MDKNQIATKFLENYDPIDIAIMLIEKMTIKEIEAELDSFEVIKRESEGSLS